MLPNVAPAVKRFEQTVTLRTVVVTTVDFVEMTTNTDVEIEAVIEVAKPDEILVDQVDRNISHIKVYARFTFDVGQFIIYKNKHFKIIQVSDWIDYGYSRCIASENKNAVDI